MLENDVDEIIRGKNSNDNKQSATAIVSMPAHPSHEITNVLNQNDTESVEPQATTLLSLLPVIVLEAIFSRLDRTSIDYLYEADPYIEHIMDVLPSVQRLKDKLSAQEEKEFKEKQFALWRERLIMIHQRQWKKVN